MILKHDHAPRTRPSHGLNDLNGAKRLNGLNVLNAHQSVIAIEPFDEVYPERSRRAQGRLIERLERGEAVERLERFELFCRSGIVMHLPN